MSDFANTMTLANPAPSSTVTGDLQLCLAAGLKERGALAKKCLAMTEPVA